MTPRRALALLLLAAAVAAFLALGGHQALRLDQVQARLADLQAWRDARPLAAAGLYMAIYIAATALSLPGATVLTLLGGALFGLGWGLVLVSFASSIGATLAFLASRWLLGGWVRQRLGSRLAAIDAGVARDGAFYLLSLRLLPVVPFFVVNLALGLTPMRAAVFYGVSQLGMLPGTVVYVNAGTQLAAIDSLAGIASGPVLGALALLGLLPWAVRPLLRWLQRRRALARWPRPKRFDRNLVVIGGGAAGLVTAYIAAAVKARVTLVEQHALGGDCLHTGCVPSKALIRAARAAHEVRPSRRFGVDGGEPAVDFAAVMDHVQRSIAAIAPHDSAARYTALGVDVVMGRARIATPWQVDITRPDGTQQVLTTRAIVIAAGAQPVLPAIPGIDAVQPLTSDTVWSLRRRPGRLLVLGGGPIGCELGQAFARLGSHVTLVEAADRLLAREDADVADAVAAALAADGVDLRLGHAALRFECHGEGHGEGHSEGNGEAKRLVARHAGAEVVLPFETLLVAVGRAARLQGYGLEDLGIATGRTVQVDGWLQTAIPTIYAAGDVAGPWQFTHAAAHQAWHAAVNALFAPFKRFAVNGRALPAVTFTAPEVARVGLNRREAADAGIAVEATRVGLDDLDRAILDGDAAGWVEVLTPPGRDRILGVTIVGAQAGELLAEWVLAMQHGIGLNQLLGTVHAYPTLAEANKAAAGAWKRAHAPQRLLAWVERFHAWRRG